MHFEDAIKRVRETKENLKECASRAHTSEVSIGRNPLIPTCSHQQNSGDTEKGIK